MGGKNQLGPSNMVRLRTAAEAVFEGAMLEDDSGGRWWRCSGCQWVNPDKAGPHKVGCPIGDLGAVLRDIDGSDPQASCEGQDQGQGQGGRAQAQAAG